MPIPPYADINDGKCIMQRIREGICTMPLNDSKKWAEQVAGRDAFAHELASTIESAHPNLTFSQIGNITDAVMTFLDKKKQEQDDNRRP